MKKNKSNTVTEQIPAVNEEILAAEPTPACDTCENPIDIEKQDKKEKETKVMKRYSNAPSVSHLLLLVFSLVFIALLVVPNAPYIYYGGFGADNNVPAVNFVFHFLQVMGWADIPLFHGYTDFMQGTTPLLEGIGIPANIYLIVMASCLVAALIIFIVVAVYSFVCLSGGIGRKHAMRLGYTLLAGAIIGYAPAIALFAIGMIQHHEAIIYPLASGACFIVAIILTIICHVIYSKYIKHTISEKEALANTPMTLEETSEETPVGEIKEDNVEHVDTIIQDLHEENQQGETIAEGGQETPIAPKEELEKQETPVVEEAPTPAVEEKPQIIEEPKEKTVTSVTPNYDLSKGLPEGVSELGDHAFSKNLDLEYAIIPEGIVKIGPACFANCLNLKAVFIPKTVEKISFNAFFACKKLTKITYAGTKVEWKKIVRGSNWLTSAGTKVVVCSDGAVSVNPFH